MGQKIPVYVPHVVTTVLDQKGRHWLSPSRTLKFQALLIEPDYVTLKTTAVVNPATFLSPQHEESKPEHDCLQEEVYSSRPNLKYTLLQDTDLELYQFYEGWICSHYCWDGSGSSNTTYQHISPEVQIHCPHSSFAVKQRQMHKHLD